MVTKAQGKSSISIIIVNYNAKVYLEACLKSVLNTKYDNFEVIVVDDASEDGSQDYLKDMLSLTPNFKAIYNDKNLGPALARNQGSKEAKGEYIVYIDSSAHCLRIK